MEQIQQLENTISGYDKLLSDPELGNMAVQYMKESMERIELLVIGSIVFMFNAKDVKNSDELLVLKIRDKW
ncbi:hypothetical protein TNIN_42351 [Trichonephila inaurata madagascariensis]|uniref:Uncharacterized protein n=1 Tax=Trichonephila inaurata madagascariensis TaxID=2747483 RepID=A0A8X6YPR5_9ARAC|nr:hypothetical protein TNIN_42351 [Trichonephila inaurata madagascariensis]